MMLNTNVYDLTIQYRLNQQNTHEHLTVRTSSMNLVKCNKHYENDNQI